MDGVWVFVVIKKLVNWFCVLLILWEYSGGKNIGEDFVGESKGCCVCLGGCIGCVIVYVFLCGGGCNFCI